MESPGTDRDNALLTKRQREFLAGETDIDPESSHARTMRTRIRRRAREGLFDFQHLHQLPDEDISRIFAPIPTDEKATEGNIVEAIDYTVAFLMLGVTATNPADNVQGRPTLGFFAHIIETALERVLPRRGEVADPADIEVKIDIDRRGLEDTDLSEVPYRQLKQLLVAEEITPQEYADAVNAKEAETDED